MDHAHSMGTLSTFVVFADSPKLVLHMWLRVVAPPKATCPATRHSDTSSDSGGLTERIDHAPWAVFRYLENSPVQKFTVSLCFSPPLPVFGSNPSSASQVDSGAPNVPSVTITTAKSCYYHGYASQSSRSNPSAAISI